MFVVQIVLAILYLLHHYLGDIILSCRINVELQQNKLLKLYSMKKEIYIKRINYLQGCQKSKI